MEAPRTKATCSKLLGKRQREVGLKGSCPAPSRIQQQKGSILGLSSPPGLGWAKTAMTVGDLGGGLSTVAGVRPKGESFVVSGRRSK